MRQSGRVNRSGLIGYTARIMDDQPNRILKEVFGYDAFRGPQQQIVDHVIAGGDALVLMPTGGGKSLCYQIPAIAREGVGIVVSPLIALMHDQVTALRQLGVRAAYVNSSLTGAEASEVERQMRAGELDLVYVAPERLCTERFLAQLPHTPLALFAIDEAHCVSQWGHDFRPEYRQLTALHERFPDVPRMALTATADQPTREDIVAQLELGEAERFISGFDRPNIRYTVTPKASAKKQLLRFIETEHPGEAGIVYCLSRKKTEATAEFLSEHGHTAIPYHAGLDAEVRKAHQDRFILEEGLIVVATIAFGMGIDKPDVRFVAHLDLPKSMEAYYQETGRAGRDGLPSDAWMTYGLQDATLVRSFITNSDAPPQQKQLENRKLDTLLAYCETTQCRRHVLLRYFGETPDGSGCGNCDTCTSPVETWDATDAARKALSCAYRTEQTFGAAHLIDVLLGNDTEKVLRFRHHEVSTFGIGADLSKKQWSSVYRQLIAMGMLSVDGLHGSLRLTAAARPVLTGEQSLTLRKDPEQKKRGRRPARTKRDLQFTNRADSELFQALRAKRLELAREQGVPPYVVFNDSSLMEMAMDRPADAGAMRNISGVGDRKLTQYGETFLDVIAEHAGGTQDREVAQDRESMARPGIATPQAARPVVSTDAGLSDTAAMTAELLRKGRTVDQIAEARSLQPSTIYAHLADAVQAGMIEPTEVLTMDDAEIGAIEDAILELPDDEATRLKPVFERFEGRYDYGVLRCVQAAMMREEGE